jgi:hypothetical protein
VQVYKDLILLKDIAESDIATVLDENIFAYLIS